MKIAIFLSLICATAVCECLVSHDESDMIYTGIRRGKDLLIECDKLHRISDVNSLILALAKVLILFKENWSMAPNDPKYNRTEVYRVDAELRQASNELDTEMARICLALHGTPNV